MVGTDHEFAPGERLTWREFSRLDDSEHRNELIDGRLYRAPLFTADEQAIIANLTAAFIAFRRGESKGDLVGSPYTLALCQHDNVEPAFIWCPHEWMPRIFEGGNVFRAPDLVVEFESASAHEEQYSREKRTLYERHGVREYWRIDIAARTVTIDRFDPVKGAFDESPTVVSPGEQLTLAALPAFALSTDDIFVRPVAKLTYDDLVRMPQDLLRHELIDGVHFAWRVGR